MTTVDEEERRRRPTSPTLNSPLPGMTEAPPRRTTPALTPRVERPEGLVAGGLVSDRKRYGQRELA